MRGVAVAVVASSATNIATSNTAHAVLESSLFIKLRLRRSVQRRQREVELEQQADQNDCDEGRGDDRDGRRTVAAPSEEQGEYAEDRTHDHQSDRGVRHRRDPRDAR